MAKQREVAFDALLHGGLGKPLVDPVAGRFVGALLPQLRQVLLTSGILDVRE